MPRLGGLPPLPPAIQFWSCLPREVKIKRKEERKSERKEKRKSWKRARSYTLQEFPWIHRVGRIQHWSRWQFFPLISHNNAKMLLWVVFKGTGKIDATNSVDISTTSSAPTCHDSLKTNYHAIKNLNFRASCKRRRKCSLQGASTAMSICCYQ